MKALFLILALFSLNACVSDKKSPLKFIGKAPGAANAVLVDPVVPGPEIKIEKTKFEAMNETLIKGYCIGCHQTERVRDGVVRKPSLRNEEEMLKYIIPGDVENSQLYDSIIRHRMPPSDKKQPSAEEIEILKEYIESLVVKNF